MDAVEAHRPLAQRHVAVERALQVFGGGVEHEVEDC
jgi:hypothetical protein